MPARDPRPADPSPGLCATCAHSAVVRGARSHFWMCRLSASDASFPRYPRLPVLSCRGYTRGEPPAGTGEADAPPGSSGDGGGPD